ncbi:hypothetical protein P167DRAFT_306875 [Morchella conica CCBAS932]|uniref:Nuclease-associated modular DNA-binding 1 domain-containing protein n=1 Tax=Morchella conica CCBAS932 TaxID=1392247 RepID=A0A3N4KA91_9PEZI|nr:hypothetical protein P167DRAFT_306875 [Morchella conica CCBAS932]
MSLSRSNSIKIEVTDLELNIKTIYHSISEAARVLNMPAGFTGLRSVARVARAMHPPLLYLSHLHLVQMRKRGDAEKKNIRLGAALYLISQKLTKEGIFFIR